MKMKMVKQLELTSIKPMVNMSLVNLECRKIICMEEVKATIKAK